MTWLHLLNVHFIYVKYSSFKLDRNKVKPTSKLLTNWVRCSNIRRQREDGLQRRQSQRIFISHELKVYFIAARFTAGDLSAFAQLRTNLNIVVSTSHLDTTILKSPFNLLHRSGELIQPELALSFSIRFPFTSLSVFSGLWGPEVARSGCDVPQHPSITQNRLYSDAGRGEICVICSQMPPSLSMPAAGVVIGMWTKMAPLCLIKLLH